MMRNLFLYISLLVIFCADRALCKSVFSSSPKAHMLLRSRRANTFMEEFKAPSLERECKEEVCDFEEAREIFNTREATMKFWTVYLDGNQCDSHPCVNGKCVDLFQDYSCICSPGFEGRRCDLRSTATNCSVNNGDCDHDCRKTEDGLGRICSCIKGYQLQDNARNCAPKSDYDRFKREGTEETITVKQHFTHPQYNPITRHNDIALLQLFVPAKFSKYILPACLPSHDLAEQVLHRNGTLTIVTGWGKKNETDHRYSDTLNFIEIPLVDTKECSKHMMNNLTQNMLCAGVLGQVKDACEVDSGGPMMTLFHDTWFLLGLVSWGEGCGHRDQLGIYTKVSSYLNWIDSVRQGQVKV
nr:vitamin K-dependent protein C-like isoform X2 [Misgurnus anguillicaudatus]